MKVFSVLGWILRFVVLIVLFNVLFISGAQVVSGVIPNSASEPGLVSAEMGVLIMSIVNTFIVMALILSSRWSGLKLALGLSFSYYGVVTFMMQIETWYFLSDITVGEQLLPRLFVMGMPVAFVFIPLAVWIMGKGRSKVDLEDSPMLVMTAKQWAFRLGLIAIAYVILYWSAGYFIAWQNPELRAFYGSPGEIQPFWIHTIDTLRLDPELFFFQILRGILWALCALPIIRGSKLNVWWTALLVGVVFSMPQNISHILENPLMPIASIRFSHMIETASSTFIFGLIVTHLLYGKREAVH